MVLQSAERSQGNVLCSPLLTWRQRWQWFVSSCEWRNLFMQWKCKRSSQCEAGAELPLPALATWLRISWLHSSCWNRSHTCLSSWGVVVRLIDCRRVRYLPQHRSASRALSPVSLPVPNSVCSPQLQVGRGRPPLWPPPLLLRMSSSKAQMTTR